MALTVPRTGLRVDTPQIIELAENQTVAGIKLPDTDVAYLQQLQRFYKGLKIEKDGSALSLSFQGLCGVLPLPSGAVLQVKPKVPADVLNLLAWVARCPELLNPTAYESAHWISVVLLYELVRRVSSLLRQGLLQGFRTEREALTQLRGRLNVAGQVEQIGRGQWQRLACEYEDVTFDCLENRILYWAARGGALALPRYLPGVAQVCSELARLAHELKSMGVSDEPFDPSEVSRINFTRLNQHYRPAIELAKMLFAGISVQDTVAKSNSSWKVLPGFILDTAQLFETSVAQGVKWAMRQAWGEAKVDIQQSSHLLHMAGLHSAQYRRLCSVRTDMEVELDGQTVAVLETKYKLLGASLSSEERYDFDVQNVDDTEAEAPSDQELGRPVEEQTQNGLPERGDVYQVLCYCLARGTTRAILVYPAFNPQAPPVELLGHAWTKVGGSLPRIHLWWLQCNCALSGTQTNNGIELVWHRLAETVKDCISKS